MIIISQYDVLVDIYAHRKNRRPVFEERTCYGQLDTIIVCRLPPYQLWSPQAPLTLVLAAIRQTNSVADPQTGVHHYKELGSLEMVDMGSVQGLVGRVYNRNQWAIIDRGGELMKAQFINNDEVSEVEE
ncbi:hypothetical protein M422DRAFT_171281 [Sphaerobolus stellatus SS14]|uniref:Uncharacterized protein n=1 Tax=Sphaerobolus stellatus (strain SS14) TaxID=990650 RepID=A0A0C9VUQ0_SPHS4|nr:hypothetical protein M422DRAFT_171281 [Sphaerobolus stellatus SS14]